MVNWVRVTRVTGVGSVLLGSLGSRLVVSLGSGSLGSACLFITMVEPKINKNKV